MSDRARRWYEFVTANADPKKATLRVYDEINPMWGVSASVFSAELDALDVDELDVRINSPGGSAFEGLAIANAIIRHPAHVTTYNDGLAASAASLILLAGDEVVTTKYGQGMLHNAQAAVMGTATDLREVAKGLDRINAGMAQFYADRAGGTAEEWAKAMAKETWYTGDELVEAGLAHRVETAEREEVEKAVASALACSTTQFKFAGRQAVPAPDVRTESTKAAAAVGNSTEGVSVADKKTLAESLGLSADATEEDILKATRDALGITDDDADDTDAGGAGADDAAGDGGAADAADAGAGAPGKVGELATAAAKQGLVLMDPDQVAKLQRDAAAGAEARANQIAAAHASVVDDAIAKGKIAPTRRTHFMALMKADEQGTTALLAGIPPETAVPMTEMGHAMDAQASAQTGEQEVLNDPRYKNWSI